MELGRLFGKERKQVLSNHEVVNELREAALDMFYCGVTGSEEPICRRPQGLRHNIPTLLRYSKNTRDHFQTLISVLSAPREFQIADMPNQAWKSEEPDGDVIYEKDEVGEHYRFTHYLTAPFLDAVTAALSDDENFQSWLDVSFLAYKKSGIWKLGYSFLVFEPFNMYDSSYVEGNYASNKRNMGGGVTIATGAQPERELLLNFIFSPQPLSAKWFVDNYFFKTQRKYLRDLGKEKIESFNVIRIFFNALSMANDLKKQDGFIPDALNSSYSLEIYSLRKEGNREIGIVDLGTVDIGSLTYHIYSAAEQPLVYETATVFNAQHLPVLKPSFASIQIPS